MLFLKVKYVMVFACGPLGGKQKGSICSFPQFQKKVQRSKCPANCTGNSFSSLQTLRYIKSKLGKPV